MESTKILITEFYDILRSHLEHTPEEPIPFRGMEKFESIITLMSTDVKVKFKGNEYESWLSIDKLLREANNER